MDELRIYKGLTEKRRFFHKSRSSNHYNLEQINQFDDWYNKELSLDNSTKRIIYRGMSSAEYKLYNSAQRFWILNSLTMWKGKEHTEYLKMFKFMLNRAKKDFLFEKVFEFYKLKKWEIDFPLMSILQHYGSPTPLLDWTYNLDVALYFATEQIKYFGKSNSPKDYFSIYKIDKSFNHDYTFINLKGVSINDTPKVDDYFKYVDQKNKIYFLSDFEDFAIKKKNIIGQFTSIYNQNIIPQEGMLIFNPFPTDPFEEYFSKASPSKKPIYCVNIHKHMAEYIRRRLKKKRITKSFIYPSIMDNAKNALNTYLDDITKLS